MDIGLIFPNSVVHVMSELGTVKEFMSHLYGWWSNCVEVWDRQIRSTVILETGMRKE